MRVFRFPARPSEFPRQPWTEADVMTILITVAGHGGQASWQRLCRCGHSERHHRSERCTMVCSCFAFISGQTEILELWLDPDAVDFLPEGVEVYAHGRRWDEGMLQFVLRRDVDSSVVQVVRSGVKRETVIYSEGEQS